MFKLLISFFVNRCKRLKAIGKRLRDFSAFTFLWLSIKTLPFYATLYFFKVLGCDMESIVSSLPTPIILQYWRKETQHKWEITGLSAAFQQPQKFWNCVKMRLNRDTPQLLPMCQDLLCRCFLCFTVFRLIYN